MAVNKKLWIHVYDDIHQRTNLYCLRIIILGHWFHDICAQTRSIYCLGFFFSRLLFISYYRHSLWRGHCVLSWRIQSKKGVKFTDCSRLDMFFCGYSYSIYDNVKYLGYVSMDPSITWRLHPAHNDWFDAWFSLSKLERFRKLFSSIK